MSEIVFTSQHKAVDRSQNLKIAKVYKVNIAANLLLKSSVNFEKKEDFIYLFW